MTGAETGGRMGHRCARWVSIVGVASALSASAVVAVQVRDAAPAPAPAAGPAEKTRDATIPPRPQGATKGEAATTKGAGAAATAKAKVVRPAPVAGMAAMAADENRKAMVEQWSGQFRPILQVEYQFLRAACAPTKEQRRPIARAGQEALKVAAEKFADWQLHRNRVVGGRVERPAQPDVHKIIQEAMAAAAEVHLSPGQRQRYRHEVEARTAERKQGALLNLVSKLDQCLVLSVEQRDKLMESLSSHWDDGWTQELQISSLDDPYFPVIADQHVVPFLNGPQREVWAGAQKVTRVSYGFINGMMMDDGPLDDEFPDEVSGDEPKPEAKR
jgi:hypothetical protein